MAAWLWVVVYAVAILTIVLIHEAGHFFTAKAFRIKVEQFFVGFGPRLWSTRRGETEYGIKALPFGGYVRIAGMNPLEEIRPEDAPRTFQSKPLWQRAVVIATGPITHFFMAMAFLALFFAAIGASVYRPQVDGVQASLNGRPSPASTAGLRVGDEVLAVDGRTVRPNEDAEAIVASVVATTKRHTGRPMELEVRRGRRVINLQVTPVPVAVAGTTVGRIGVILGAGVVAHDRANPIAAIGRGSVATYDTAKQVIFRLGDVFGPSGLKRIAQELAGTRPRGPGDVTSVVGGGRVVVQAAEAGAWQVLILLLAEFNVFIGILNLVPLPPLDGGHLAVIAYEKVRGRRPDVRKLIPLTALVAAFMIVFALSITYLDIVNPLPNQFR